VTGPPALSALAVRVRRAAEAARPITRFLDSPLASRAGDPAVANFLFGNPQEMPLRGFVTAIEGWSEPQHKDWFAYTSYHRPAQDAIAASLASRFAIPFAPDDVLMTTGAFGGLSLLLTALVDPGDEVIFLSPPWFFYESMILLAGGEPVRVTLAPPAFDLDIDRIAAAITPRTRAIIVNSAQNPTGRVYEAATLSALASTLRSASDRHGRPIALFSDESYSRILYDGRTFSTPTAFYPFSFLVYTYGKVLLTPGQRLGYVALAPGMPGRDELRHTLFDLQMIHGWTFPNAVMQYAVPDLEPLSIDIGRLQQKRDRVVSAMREMGYEVESPESTFYVLPRSPIADDQAFCERLAAHDVLCMPGRMFNLPGYFRLSLTASDAMIDRALDALRLTVPPS
jgi:aspartate aminotransferase